MRKLTDTEVNAWEASVRSEGLFKKNPDIIRLFESLRAIRESRKMAEARWPGKLK